MSKLVVLSTFIIIIVSLTVNPYLTLQVESSPESSSFSSDDDGDATESNDSEAEDESEPDNSEGTDSSSDGSDDEGEGINEEPPTSMERRGDPIPDLDVSLW